MPTRIPVVTPSGTSVVSSPAGSGYWIAVAPSALAVAIPAGDDPDIRRPGRSSSGIGGVSLSALAVYHSPVRVTVSPAASAITISVNSWSRS